MRRSLSPFALAPALLALGAASAWAQDYTVTSVSGQYVSPPSGTTNLISTVKGRDNVAFTLSGSNVPFPIFYFGQYYSSLSVCSNGFVQFGGGTATTAFATNFPLTTPNDGICAPAWDDLDGQGTSSVLTYWTDGTAPNRRFIVGWIAWQQALNTGTLAFQVQFHEGSGRIQMAYASGWTGQTRAKAVGIDALGSDSRFVTPDGSSLYFNTPTSQPANDWRFDPRITNFSGRLNYDRLVVDASGIGNTTQQNVALSGVGVEVRNASGAAVASGSTDSSGDFAIQGMALVASDSGSLVAVARGPAATVRTSAGGAAYAFTLATNVSFGPDRAFGTLAITNGNDSGAAARAPLHVATTIQGAYDWCRARTSGVIQPIDVLYDTTSAAATSYTPAAASAATLRVSGATANPDPWDTPVLRKTYARHVIAAIAAAPSSSIDATYDRVTADDNAFAEGFGYYLHAAISRDTKYTDGISSSAATEIDLEAPSITSAKGPAVAAWVAAALYDLTDGTNESWDTFDGAGSAADRVFQVADLHTSAVTAASFYTAWGVSGFDGPSLARNFIRHGLIGDDADEPNDDAAEARAVSPWGFLRPARILNLYNEDWYSFTVPAATNALTVDVVYDRRVTDAGVTLELQSAAGAVLATGAFSGTLGPMHLVTGPMSPGNYRARLRHDSGARLDAYAIQAFSELTFTSAPFPSWTVSRPYSVALDVQGGVAPYVLSVEQPSVLLPGLQLDSQNLRVTGSPGIVGPVDFYLTATDFAAPANSLPLRVQFDVNAELTFQVAEFLAFALDKDADRPGAYSGGTPPLTFTALEGALPDGLGFAPGEFRYVGAPTTPGSTHYKLQGTDVAGSSDTRETTAVVCVPFGDTPLGAGPAACGFYFDGVLGTSVSIGVKTAKKEPKRDLRVAIIGPDGGTTIPAPVKTGKGKASVSKFIAPFTGRFYCVLASDAGDPTHLTGTGKVLAPKKGGGDNGDGDFVPGDTFSVEFGALAGATLTFTAKPRKPGLQMKAQFFLDPDGNPLPIAAGDFVESKGSVTVTKVLTASGTWSITLGAKSGAQGQFTYKYKLAEPKDGVYSED